MDELPEGPVSIMFTDIEGSTALRTTLGDAETGQLFRQHDDLIREQITAHKGQDQKAALGDGFLAVFVSTRRAVACAIAIQRALDAFNRSRRGPQLRVRIGINTGEVAFADGQLSGEAVHAAARVCAASEGGQILVSDVTRQLTGTVPDVTFRDTGEHQLKGFPEPWRLWDVVWVRETSSAPQEVFVGREHELAMLRTKLAQAIDGRGGLVLIGGEPGVGKTALVRQLISEAEQRGALPVFGRCYESEGAVPYSPFVEMLEQALATIPPDIVREDIGADAPEIARMVPELRRRFPDVGEALDLPPEQQRRYFFNAVASFVGRAAARFPLVLIMDDVHWADEPTLLLIEHMAALMPHMRVLGIGTYRDVELEVARPLAASLERMHRARTVERVSLSRFDRGGVASMIQALAGKPPPNQIVDAVYSETEGNLFFVSEVYRHFVEDGKVFDEAGDFRTDLAVDELDVPESVRLVVGRRLERLGEQAQRVLAIGAVVGRAFPFPLLEALSDLDAGTLLDIVDDAESARVIVSEEREGEVYFSFAHELIRQTLLSGLSLLRRQRMHLAVANSIERLDPAARVVRPSEIANHLLQAGSAAEPERLLECLEASAKRALEGAAFEEAVRAVDDALAVLGDGDTDRRASLLYLRGTALRALGDFDGCIEIWNQVMELYAEVGNGPAAAGLAFQLGYLQQWLARFVDAYGTYAKGLELAGDARVAEGVLCQGGLTAFSGFMGLYDEASKHHEQGLELARELGDRRALGVTEWSWCVTEWTYLNLASSVAAGREAVDHLRASNELWTLADALTWLSFPLLWGGTPEEAIRVAREACELGAKLGHRASVALARRTLALAASIAEPDLATLESEARREVEAFEEIDSPWAAMSHCWLSQTLVDRGDIEQAMREAEAAVRLDPASVWNGFGWCARILSLAAAGAVEECRAMLREPIPAPAAHDEPVPAGSCFKLHYAAVAASMTGSAEDAHRLYPSLAAQGLRLRYVGFDMGIAERYAGMAAATAGMWEEAEAAFAAAERRVNEEEHVRDRPHLNLWQGKMLLDRGRPRDRERGTTQIRAARDEFVMRGARYGSRLSEEILSRA